MPITVFIGWSGATSRSYAEAFRSWLPVHLQAVTPWFSPNDVEKGARWFSEIAAKLEDASVGIFCLTQESLNSPWIMFEAGALSKQVGKSRVCPVLFGIEQADLPGPFQPFQSAAFAEEDIKDLLRTLNAACGDARLETAVLDQVIERAWPEIEAAIRAVPDDPTPGPAAPGRTADDMLHEILELCRLTARGRAETQVPRDIIRTVNALARGVGHETIAIRTTPDAGPVIETIRRWLEGRGVHTRRITNIRPTKRGGKKATFEILDGDVGKLSVEDMDAIRKLDGVEDARRSIYSRMAPD